MRYQKIGRTSSLIRNTLVGRLQGKDLATLLSSIRPRFCHLFLARHKYKIRVEVHMDMDLTQKLNKLQASEIENIK